MRRGECIEIEGGAAGARFEIARRIAADRRAQFAPVDSRYISKYIGETEKNLHRLLERTARRNWILFFDEADALFGKRTEVKDAHDRYSNHDVRSLLTRQVAKGSTVIFGRPLGGRKPCRPA